MEGQPLNQYIHNIPMDGDVFERLNVSNGSERLNVDDGSKHPNVNDGSERLDVNESSKCQTVETW